MGEGLKIHKTGRFFSHQPTAGQINRRRAINILTEKRGGATERFTNCCLSINKHSPHPPPPHTHTPALPLGRRKQKEKTNKQKAEEAGRMLSFSKPHPRASTLPVSLSNRFSNSSAKDKSAIPVITRPEILPILLFLLIPRVGKK